MNCSWTKTSFLLARNKTRRPISNFRIMAARFMKHNGSYLPAAKYQMARPTAQVGLRGVNPMLVLLRMNREFLLTYRAHYREKLGSTLPREAQRPLRQGSRPAGQAGGAEPGRHGDARGHGLYALRARRSTSSTTSAFQKLFI